MNGLIDLYKPTGISSAKAVSRVKHILGESTVGHMGTLDPMAEGVLVIGVGKSARLFEYISGRRKTYLAKFKFGYETDTLDKLGTVTGETHDIPSVDAVMGAASTLRGKVMQTPPVYSAKHIDGKRAYELARSGKNVDVKPVEVEIYDISLVTQPAMDEFVFSIECSAGTYIRSICRDIGRMCGSLATLTYLQRTRSGIFTVNDAVTPESLEVIKGGALVKPDVALADMPRYDVAVSDKSDLDNGRKISCELDGNARIYCGGEFYGIGRSESGVLKIKTYLKDDKS